jgi:hypothetical protein
MGTSEEITPSMHGQSDKHHGSSGLVNSETLNVAGLRSQSDGRRDAASRSAGSYVALAWKRALTFDQAPHSLTYSDTEQHSGTEFQLPDH